MTHILSYAFLAWLAVALFRVFRLVASDLRLSVIDWAILLAAPVTLTWYWLVWY